MLEEKEQNIQDLKTRLDQTRKMNEALRTLLDKQDEGVPSSSHKVMHFKLINFDTIF